MGDTDEELTRLNWVRQGEKKLRGSSGIRRGSIRGSLGGQSGAPEARRRYGGGTRKRKKRLVRKTTPPILEVVPRRDTNVNGAAPGVKAPAKTKGEEEKKKRIKLIPARREGKNNTRSPGQANNYEKQGTRITMHCQDLGGPCLEKKVKQGKKRLGPKESHNGQKNDCPIKEREAAGAATQRDFPLLVIWQGGRKKSPIISREELEYFTF